MEGCDNIKSCGAQSLIMMPFFVVLSSKLCFFIHFSKVFEALTTHMNGLFDDSNPNANCISWGVVKLWRLPKQMYSTEFGACESSHFITCSLLLLSSFSVEDLPVEKLG